MWAKDYLSFSFKDLHLGTGFVQAEVASNGGRNSNKTSALHGDKNMRLSHDYMIAVMHFCCIADLSNFGAIELLSESVLVLAYVGFEARDSPSKKGLLLKSSI